MSDLGPRRILERKDGLLSLKISRLTAPVVQAASGVGAGVFTANWTASTPANQLMWYIVQVSTSENFNEDDTDEFKAEGLSKQITGLAPGTYYYRVFAYGTGGYSVPSGRTAVIVP